MGLLLLLVVHGSTPWFIPKIPYGLPISLHFVQTSMWVPPGKDFILTCLPYSIEPSLGKQNPSWVCPFAARVKINKARRANQTKAHGSCFCCSSQQFNDTRCNQMQKGVALVMEPDDAVGGRSSALATSLGCAWPRVLNHPKYATRRIGLIAIRPKFRLGPPKRHSF